MSKTLVEMAADIIQAQSSTKSMSAEEITTSLQSTYKALQDLQMDEARFAQTGEAGAAVGGPAISPEKSILKNKIICLECGQEFRMLSPKHLKSHDLTGRTYREKYGFSLRQPLCAKSLSDRRKKAVKARGLPENLRKAIDARKKNKTTKKAAAKKTTAKKVTAKKATAKKAAKKK